MTQRAPGRDHGEAEETAVRLLARREHSVLELRRKLRQRGYAVSVVERVLQQLQQQRLLSDERFAEAYVRSRSDKGFGPLRIRGELRERGLDAALIDSFVMESDPRWRDLLRRVRERRFGAALPADHRERMRQARFLQQRGFEAGEIRELLQQQD